MVAHGLVIAQLVVLLVLALFVLLPAAAAAVYFRVQLSACETSQSPFCLSVVCPAAAAGLGSAAPGACNGFSQRDGPNGTECSSGPQLVPQSSS